MNTETIVPFGDGYRSLLLLFTLCTILLLEKSHQTLAAEIVGAEKLTALQVRAPSMLGRSTLKVGQWIETEVQCKVRPKGNTPTAMERLFSQGIDRTTKGRREIVALTEKEAVLKSGKARQALARDHFWSSNNWERASALVQGLTGGSVRFIQIVDAEYQGIQTIHVGAKELSCGTCFVSWAARATAPNSEKEHEFQIREFSWFHESIPIEGLAKSVSEISTDFRGERIHISVTETYVSSGGN